MLKNLSKRRGAFLESSPMYVPKKEKEVLKMCRKCYSFRYDNGWHFEKPEYLLEKDMDEEIYVQFSQCPACVEETLAMYDMEYA